MAKAAIAKPINNNMAIGINQPNHPIDPIKAKQSAFIMAHLLLKQKDVQPSLLLALLA
ncbi:MAG: hypothetical protein ACQES7_03805 [Pseudomonadota bacterium]